MAKVLSIKKSGKEPVYNMCVDEFHNYLIKGGILSKNCDALRYYATYWVTPAQEHTKKRKKWRKDLIEDYKRASKEVRALMIKNLGEPIL